MHSRLWVVSIHILCADLMCRRAEGRTVVILRAETERGRFGRSSVAATARPKSQDSSFSMPRLPVCPSRPHILTYDFGIPSRRQLGKWYHLHTALTALEVRFYCFYSPFSYVLLDCHVGLYHTLHDRLPEWF